MSICAGDHTGWDREEIIEMLGIFLNITGAISLPDPKEYYWRSDKVTDLLAICSASACNWDLTMTYCTCLAALPTGSSAHV